MRDCRRRVCARKRESRGDRGGAGSIQDPKCTGRVANGSLDRFVGYKSIYARPNLVLEEEIVICERRIISLLLAKSTSDVRVRVCVVCCVQLQKQRQNTS